MKKLSHKLSVLGIVCFSVLFLVGILLAFVPIKIGSKNYNSFFGSIAVSNELGNGMTATYDILDSPSATDIQKSTEHIKKLLVSWGYTSSSVYVLDGKQIAIEIPEPVVDDLIPNAEESLKKLGGGQIVLSTAKTFEEIDAEGVVTIYAPKQFKDINIQTYNNYSGVVVEFNNEGKELYRKTAGKTIYMYLDGVAFPDTSNNSVESGYDPLNSTSTDFTLWFATYETAEYYSLVFKCGMLPVNLDSDSIIISYTEPTSLIFLLGKALLPLLVLLLAVILLAVVFMVIKYRALGVISLFAFAFNVIIALFLFQALSWVEVGIASLATIILVILFNVSGNILYFNKIQNEYKTGKSIETSIDIAYKKSLSVILETSIIVILFGVAIALIGQGTFASIGTILAIGGVLNLLSNLLLVKLFISFYFTFNNSDEKKYALKREDTRNEN